MATRQLVLWDVDGTILSENRACYSSVLRALTNVYCVMPNSPLKGSAGSTDEQIVIDALIDCGFSVEDVTPRLSAFAAHYYELLQAGFADLRSRMTLLPGVAAVMAHLRCLGAVQTLLTGNLECVARLKLAAVGLEGYLDLGVGAYGSDDRVRANLVPIALSKASEKYRCGFSPIVVIGDTPKDIACGHAAGVRAVAVATGDFSAVELLAHRPNAVLENLTDTSNSVTAILG